MRFQIRPKLRSHKKWYLVMPALAAVALSACVAGSALADELTTPATATEASGSRPARGMSMEKVEAAFGAPATRAPAVGEPPITRWEYPGFTVYFEHQLVIHTVASG